MSKKLYEKPLIVKHKSGFMNKYGSAVASTNQETIDGVRIDELVSKYGSPLFVFSQSTLERKFQEAIRAFSYRYPDVVFAWSYKTNYLKAICQILHKQGAIAEVVSDFEYEKARRLGIEGKNIIYNGPYKPEPSLRQAISEGAKIHIDHSEELLQIEKLGKEMGIRPRVAVRINLDSGIYPQWDRFGFNLENGRALDIIERAVHANIVDVIGLHCHIGTFIPVTQPYAVMASKIARLAAELEDNLGIHIEYIDLGGGFASSNTLYSQYLSGEQSSPTFEQYAEAICPEILKVFAVRAHRPKLYMETGRAIVDDCGSLITSVVGDKRLNNGTKAVILDSGVNNQFTAFYYKHRIRPVERASEFSEFSVLYGPLCMNIDVMHPGLMFPHMNPGDKVVISPVGAYAVTQWMQFIRTRPAVVLIDKNSNHHLIRRAETIDDIEACEVLPEFLQ